MTERPANPNSTGRTTRQGAVQTGRGHDGVSAVAIATRPSPLKKIHPGWEADKAWGYDNSVDASSLTDIYVCTNSAQPTRLFGSQRIDDSWVASGSWQTEAGRPGTGHLRRKQKVVDIYVQRRDPAADARGSVQVARPQRSIVRFLRPSHRGMVLALQGAQPGLDAGAHAGISRDHMTPGESPDPGTHQVVSFFDRSCSREPSI